MINFISVTKQFGDQFFGLKDVSFAVEPGEMVLITGPSGSGKTTIMRLLTKEYLPTSGEIEFQGQLLSKIKSGQIHHHRRQIGVVFQDYKLLPELNVWENIALSLNIIGKPETEIESRVTDLLELIQMTDKAFLFPTQLSGGEAQRVSIARALAAAPAVIFADEPTGNLDPETSVTIAKLLRKINELGTTILLATHDQGVVETLAKHRMIKLDKGTVVGDSATKGKSQTKLEASVELQPDKPTKSQDTDSEPELKRETKKLTPEETAEKTAEPIETKPETKPESKPDQDKPDQPKTKRRFSLPKIWPLSKNKKTAPTPSSDPDKVRQIADHQGEKTPFADDFQDITTDTEPSKVEVAVEDIDSDE